MPFVTEHPPGAPCWFELGTTDQAAAKNFYAQLFGWAPFDSPMGPGQYYTMFKLDGHVAAAAFTLPLDMVSQGVPPHWGVYFRHGECGRIRRQGRPTRRRRGATALRCDGRGPHVHLQGPRRRHVLAVAA